ncbi:MAG: hypothetical protein B0A82_24485 [Alkalinema sp. CACIAM 70d]|nr:MAG: hypothetical protein B0A82_24485 [Alkalinema sp. CACIAM 70d]
MMYDLHVALNYYEDLLTTLEQVAAQSAQRRSRRVTNAQPAESPDHPEQLQREILKLLRSRDAVQAILMTTPKVPTETLLRLMRLDDRLRHQSGLITATLALDNWRASIQPDAAAWWWSLQTPEHWFTRLDWLWEMLSLIFLTVSVSLVVVISTRFLSGGPDVLGALAIVGQSLLTLLTAGTLTASGRKALEQIFSQLGGLGLKKHFWPVAKLALSLTLFVTLILLWSRLPDISSFFHDRGLTRYSAGELANAQSDFERAASLDPNNLPAHYNLGRLHEDLQQIEPARTRYLTAAQGEYAPAYNELGRLSLQSKKLPEAAAFLQRGLELVAQLPAGDERNHTTYALFKNMGWVRLNQARHIEAKDWLQRAIALDSTFPSPPAAAHCLLAQVLEKKKPPDNAQLEWEICQSSLVVRHPEEDSWYHIARQRLDQTGKP